MIATIEDAPEISALSALSFAAPWSEADIASAISDPQAIVLITKSDSQLLAYAICYHAGGEGVYGEIFNAALQAKAYVCDDIEALIESALACIPDHTNVYKAVAYALKLFREGKPLSEARELILSEYGSPNFTYAPQNIAFGVCGIRWGSDFEDAILKTVNLGYDTDCTVATAAATLGIMYGTSYIPEKWSKPVGDKIAVSSMIKGLNAPADLDELTKESIRLHNMIKYADREAIIAATPSRVDAKYQRYVLTSDEKTGVYATLRYTGQPTCVPDQECRVSVEIVNNSLWRWKVRADLICPDGLYSDDTKDIVIGQMSEETAEFTVKANKMPENRYNRVCLRLTRLNDGSVWSEYRLPFIVLRPNVWTINGKKQYEAGCGVTLYGDMPEHVCEATLYEPQTRKTTLICNGERPIKLELDGKVLFDADVGLYLPAYHRSPAEQRAVLMLEKGEHKLKITVRNNGKAPVFTFSYNSTHEVSEPGNNYMHIDAILK